MDECLIIGGGLIGMLTARELRAAGCRVQLVERGHTGTESSWAGGGILSPLYPWRYPDAVTALASWSQPRYEDLAQALLQESDIDPQWMRSGLLILDADDEAVAAQAWAERHAVELEVLKGTAVHDCAPELSPAVAASCRQAAWMPQVAQVRNPRLVQALRESLRRSGVIIHENTEVRAIVQEGARVRGVATPSGRLESDCVVVAGGAWSAALLEPFGGLPAVRPVRGQMLLYRAQPGVVEHILLYQARYLIPRRDGRVLVGSTLEEVGFDKSTTAQARDELHTAACALVPALARFEIERHWAGLRPGSASGVPFIGPHPEIEGLYVNAGHFRNGVVLGPASARLLADIILKRNEILDAAPYALPAHSQTGAA